MTNERLRTYIESLFENAPKTRKAIELKEEILLNLTDKYNDLIAEGKDSTPLITLPSPVSVISICCLMK
jgi:hypothetical protein